MTYKIHVWKDNLTCVVEKCAANNTFAMRDKETPEERLARKELEAKSTPQENLSRLLRGNSEAKFKATAIYKWLISNTPDFEFLGLMGDRGFLDGFADVRIKFARSSDLTLFKLTFGGR